MWMDPQDHHNSYNNTDTSIVAIASDCVTVTEAPLSIDWLISDREEDGEIDEKCVCVCTWDCVINDMSSIRQGSLSKEAARSSRAEQTTKPSDLVVDGGGGGGSSSSSVSMRITRRRQSVRRSRSLQGDAIWWKQQLSLNQSAIAIIIGRILQLQQQQQQQLHSDYYSSYKLCGLRALRYLWMQIVQQQQQQQQQKHSDRHLCTCLVITDVMKVYKQSAIVVWVE